MIDYRGYGQSEGEFPSEARLYEDAEVAWNYLTQTRTIDPSQIVIYGESLGGAVALNLAVKHPTAGGLVLQSTFTSMAEVVKQIDWLRWFPIDLLLTQRFDSLDKMRSLQVPVLILHGGTDNVVPPQLSQHLYEAAIVPKRLLLIPGKGHFSIYQAGTYSYLRAIEQFVGNQEGVQPKPLLFISQTGNWREKWGGGESNGLSRNITPSPHYSLLPTPLSH
jgi:hypothetical protein